MKKLILFFTLFVSVNAFSQTAKDADAYCLTSDAGLYQFFYDNIKYPVEAATKKVEGTLELSIDVMSDSTLTKIKTFSNLGYTIEEQAKELVKKLKFVPAIQLGSSVRSNLMLSIPIRAH